ncbi:MAG: hypothetical protein IPM39_14615 [Chloroflexi bacterium]|nr:hypothetical protein [Chloroflexota bacterium]
MIGFIFVIGNGRSLPLPNLPKNEGEGQRPYAFVMGRWQFTQKQAEFANRDENIVIAPHEMVLEVIQ